MCVQAVLASFKPLSFEFPDDSPPENFAKFLDAINKSLGPLDMEIRRGISEDDGAVYYGLVRKYPLLQISPILLSHQFIASYCSWSANWNQSLEIPLTKVWRPCWWNKQWEVFWSWPPTWRLWCDLQTKNGSSYRSFWFLKHFTALSITLCMWTHKFKVQLTDWWLPSVIRSVGSKGHV